MAFGGAVLSETRWRIDAVFGEKAFAECICDCLCEVMTGESLSIGDGRGSGGCGV